MARPHSPRAARKHSPLRHLPKRPASSHAWLRVIAIGAAASGALLAVGQARADTPVLDKPSATITETTVFKWHFDNRYGDKMDDKYGEWLNRLNMQVTSGRFTAALRIDSAVFFHTPDPNRLADVDAAQGMDKTARTLYYGTQLSDRYVTAVYPSKYNLTYQHRGLEVTAGDYYVQFGKGLALAVRKVDELASDTTLRGGKIVYNPDLGKFKFNATAIAGASNPIRVDEVTGRLLSQTPGTGAERLAYPIVPRPNNTYYVPDAQPTFAPDVLMGAQAEGGIKPLQLGVRAVQLDRAHAWFQNGSDSGGPSRNADKIMIASASLNAPSIFDHGTFYFELAGQSMRDYIGGPETDPTGNKAALLGRASGGYAAYMMATAYDGPFTLSLEGKRYDRFYPMLANVGGSGPTDFGSVQYNIPPTTDPFTADFHFGSYNVCVTGARARLDARLSDQALVYASLGRYRSWSEQSTYCGEDRPNRGKTDEIRNDIVDPFVGAELNFEQSRSHAYLSSGVHFDDMAEARIRPDLPAPTTIYYRENWIRYSLLKKVYGPWSAEMVGWHRYRFNPSERPTPWHEGENYVSAIWSPKLTVAFGYEYSTKEHYWKNYFNGMVQWRFTGASFVRAYVGQNRPALRCISGVCKQFPAFEGARLEATFAF